MNASRISLFSARFAAPGQVTQQAIESAANTGATPVVALNARFTKKVIDGSVVYCSMVSFDIQPMHAGGTPMIYTPIAPR